MNTQQIQYLLEIYETRSISKAAARLYVAQPNISSSIRSLENELGFPIFKRTKYGMIPTENGLQVLDQARRMWDSYQKIQQINTGSSRKRLHVGGMPIPPAYRAFADFCLFYQNETDVDFLYCENKKPEIESFVLSDYDVQLALIPPIGITAFLAQAEARDVLATTLKELPLVLHIGPKHPLYQKADVSPADFNDYMFVDYIGSVYQGYPGLEQFFPVDRKRTIKVSNRSTKHSLVSEGTFFSIGIKLPDDMNEMYGFRNIPLEGMSYMLVLLERKNQRRSAEVQRYIQYLMEELRPI